VLNVSIESVSILQFRTSDLNRDYNHILLPAHCNSIGQSIATTSVTSTATTDAMVVDSHDFSLSDSTTLTQSITASNATTVVSDSSLGASTRAQDEFEQDHNEIARAPSPTPPPTTSSFAPMLEDEAHGTTTTTTTITTTTTLATDMTPLDAPAVIAEPSRIPTPPPLPPCLPANTSKIAPQSTRLFPLMDHFKRDKRAKSVPQEGSMAYSSEEQERERIKGSSRLRQKLTVKLAAKLEDDKRLAFAHEMDDEDMYYELENHEIEDVARIEAEKKRKKSRLSPLGGLRLTKSDKKRSSLVREFDSSFVTRDGAVCITRVSGRCRHRIHY
jgi:hypothetical protein